MITTFNWRETPQGGLELHHIVGPDGKDREPMEVHKRDAHHGHNIYKLSTNDLLFHVARTNAWRQKVDFKSPKLMTEQQVTRLKELLVIYKGDDSTIPDELRAVSSDA